MTSDIIIRKIEDDETDNALCLVWKVFLEFEAPDYTKEGVDEFYKSIHDDNYLSKLSMYGAYIQEELVGVIATRNEGTHIALFFVDSRYQRQGIGKKLFGFVKDKNTTGYFKVNSSPYAVGIYNRLGFKEVEKEHVVNGLRFVPMERQ